MNFSNKFFMQFVALSLFINLGFINQSKAGGNCWCGVAEMNEYDNSSQLGQPSWNQSIHEYGIIPPINVSNDCHWKCINRLQNPLQFPGDQFWVPSRYCSGVGTYDGVYFEGYAHFGTQAWGGTNVYRILIDTPPVYTKTCPTGQTLFNSWGGSFPTPAANYHCGVKQTSCYLPGAPNVNLSQSNANGSIIIYGERVYSLFSSPTIPKLPYGQVGAPSCSPGLVYNSMVNKCVQALANCSQLSNLNYLSFFGNYVVQPQAGSMIGWTPNAPLSIYKRMSNYTNVVTTPAFCGWQN